ncbi:hypothetical protein [Roseomonas sp. CECT 9278]|uniref:hypothetical protein n=1 Tax=Roseomonas sp. CECT 9278 TaxID=2845823 RepID=UPI001E513CA0|nr:hypothetical protein [Roseomonas sp. CECT 9278]CAH0254880.1 hypothetical protein ROS9278_03243 [Roseomonas sp. CECT 9278]
MRSLVFSTADAAAGPQPRAVPAGLGAEAIRRAQRGQPGRVALRLPAPGTDARRRVALALLEDAGRARGGAILETATGDLVLTEADPPDASRAEAALLRLFGAAPERIDLPDAMAVLLALPAPVPAAPRPLPAPAPAGIEALADAAPLPALLHRGGVLHIAAGQPRRLAFLRLRLPPAALAPHLGAAAEDPDLLHHAADRLRARLPGLLADPTGREALLGLAAPVPLLLDLPAALLPDPPAAEGDPPGTPALVAALSLREALAEGLPARRQALHHAGWGLATRGIDAASLALVAPEALPTDLLVLAWSPALAGRTATAALRRIDPARLVLDGADGQEALEWGLALGIARFAGPWIDTVMAATRMAGCAQAAGCTRAQCTARAAAAAAEGRAGCREPALLGALVPP